LNAQNFDRATQLIDEAARTKSLNAAKLTQLRDEVHKRREEFDVARLLKLVDARLQQDHLIEPRNDSAVYYLDQAKQAGAGAPELQEQTQELFKRLAQMAHTGIEQRHFGEVDHVLSEMHAIGAPAATIAGLQHELGAARNQPAAQKSDQQQFQELAQLRLSQGKLTDPDDDSALYYLNQLRNSDPNNGSLAQLSAAVQGKILEAARAALDAGDLVKALELAQLAGGIGGSSSMDAFNEKLRQAEAAAVALPQVGEQALTRLGKLEPQYPSRAMQSEIEGSVDIGFTVEANGSVVNAKVLNATPAKVFDASALKAVGRLRYQPFMQDGRAIAVQTQIRIVYRLPK